MDDKPGGRRRGGRLKMRLLENALKDLKELKMKVEKERNG